MASEESQVGSGSLSLFVVLFSIFSLLHILDHFT
jgi:hypothetical protein